MAKTKVQEWDSTPANNTDIDSVNIDEGCSPGGINNAIREVMAHVKAALTGADDGIVTGTAGSAGNIAGWNADGDLVAATGTANLESLAGLTFAANKGLYTTAANTAALFDLTPFALTILDDADAATVRGTIGLGTAAIMADSADTDLANDPDAALRRDIAKTYVDTQVATVSPDGWGYTSAATAISATSSNTFTHGLGAAPTKLALDMVCTTIDGNYAVGDRVMNLADGGVANSNYGFNFLVESGNTTEVKLLMGGTFGLRNKTTQALFNINFSRWEFIVKASL